MLDKRHTLSILCSLSLVASFSLSAGNDSWSQSGSNFSYTRTSKINKSELQNGGIRYTFSVSSPPGGYSFDTGYGTCSPGTISFPSGTATGIAEYDSSSLPAGDVSMAMSGKLITSGSGAGTQPTWDAHATLRAPYNIKSNYDNGARVITVPAGTSITYTAYEGISSKSSNWTVNGNPKNNETSIIFNRNWWDVSGWFSAGMGTPDPGVYSIVAQPTDYTVSNGENTGEMTVVGAKFSAGTCSGYDDYTNWNKGASDYYSINKVGYCTKPYISLQDNGNGTANLVLTPTPISESVNITENTSSIENLSPTDTMSSTEVSFTGKLGKGDINTTLRNTTLVSATVCAYKKKATKCFVLKVGRPDNGSYIYPDVHASISKLNYFDQTLIRVDVTPDTFNYPNPPANGAWTAGERAALKTYFENNKPLGFDEAGYKNIVFMIYNSDSGNALAWSDNTYCWVYSASNSNAPLIPHELGHNFGLDDQQSGPDVDNFMNNVSFSATMLRCAQWDTVNNSNKMEEVTE